MEDTSTNQSTADFKQTGNEENPENLIPLITEGKKKGEIEGKIEGKREREEETSSEDEDETSNEDDEDDEDCEYIVVPPPLPISKKDLAEYYRQVKESKGFNVQRFEGYIIGGIAPCYMNEMTQKLLIDLSNLALQEYNNNNGSNFEFHRLIRATQQNVSGFMYYITFAAGQDDTIKTFRGKVWDKVANLGSQVMFCEMME